MTATEMDDCLHALGQVLAFFGKELDQLQKGFWKETFRDKSPAHCLRALKEYTTSGRYAPKPKDIVELIDTYKESERVERTYVETNLPAPTCPAEIQKAWRFWLPVFHGADIGGVMGKVNASEEEAEEFLLIVNREAKRTNQPRAIPEAYKPAEVWG